MPWQFGELSLTEDNGNRIIKYADAINHGVSSRLYCIMPRCLSSTGFTKRRYVEPNAAFPSRFMSFLLRRFYYLSEPDLRLGDFHVSVFVIV